VAGFGLLEKLLDQVLTSHYVNPMLLICFGRLGMVRNILFVFLFLLIGCVPKMSPEATKVVPVTDDYKDAHCVSLGLINAFAPPILGYSGTMNKLREDIAQAGGNAFKILSQRSETYDNWVHYEITAEALKCGGKAFSANNSQSSQPQKDRKQHASSKTPLFTAIKNQDYKLASRLLQSGEDINFRMDNGMTILMKVAYKGDIQGVEFALANGAKVGLVNNHGNDALAFSVLNGSTDIFQTLIAAGADLKKSNKDEKLLFYASSHGYLKIIKYLLDHGANINYKKADSGYTPLFYAVCGKQPKAAILLINNGADTNSQDKDGASVLECAVVNGDLILVKSLLSHGGNVNMKDKDGLTALQYASEIGNKEMINFLLNSGASPIVSRKAGTINSRIKNNREKSREIIQNKKWIISEDKQLLSSHISNLANQLFRVIYVKKSRSNVLFFQPGEEIDSETGTIIVDENNPIGIKLRINGNSAILEFSKGIDGFDELMLLMNAGQLVSINIGSKKYDFPLTGFSEFIRRMMALYEKK